jgi:hypothetical protein
MISNAQFHIENIVIEMLENELDGHALGDGNIDLMINSLLNDAIKSLVEQGRIREIDPHFYQLVTDKAEEA